MSKATKLDVTIYNYNNGKHIIASHDCQPILDISTFEHENDYKLVAYIVHDFDNTKRHGPITDHLKRLRI